jgi:hypothetical protein
MIPEYRLSESLTRLLLHFGPDCCGRPPWSADLLVPSSAVGVPSESEALSLRPHLSSSILCPPPDWPFLFLSLPGLSLPSRHRHGDRAL